MTEEQQALLSDLERAQEGRADLDKAITLALGLRSMRRYDRRYVVLIGPDHGEKDLVNWDLSGGRSVDTFDGEYPPFTTSIDAALTLVPPGVEWHVSNRGQIGAKGKAFAGIYGAPFVGSECDTNAATPALALCIAALRARWS